jgi:hypothetical protein
MSTAEIKSEIKQVIDSVPEDALQDILDYLKQVQNQSSEQIKLGNNLKKILAEDRELLEKLAQ